MKPASVVKAYRNYLSSHEISEVASYSTVYYISLKASRSLLKSNHNRGFDDEHGNYKAVIGEHIAYRYEVLSVLGKGSFGRVYKVQDHKTNTTLALKIIKSGRNYRKAGTTEAQLLKLVKEKDPSCRHHIVQILKALAFRKHICIVFELLSMSLGEFMKQNYYHGSSLCLIRRFAVQILQALRLLYQLRVVHSDLKPDNILLRHPTKSALKVIDLGSGCFEDTRVNTYVQSRFYRAPEVVLGLPVTMKIDMWSFGCVLAELFLGYPLFKCEDERELVLAFAELRGPPPMQLLKKAQRASTFFDAEGNPKVVANSRGLTRKPSSTTLEEVLSCPDRQFVEFVSLCLEWDPDKRLSPVAALSHEWITDGRNEVETQKLVLRQGTRHSRHSSCNDLVVPYPSQPMTTRERRRFEFGTN
jgi:serine/threonine protein kinase